MNVYIFAFDQGGHCDVPHARIFIKAKTSVLAHRLLDKHLRSMGYSAKAHRRAELEATHDAAEQEGCVMFSQMEARIS